MAAEIMLSGKLGYLIEALYNSVKFSPIWEDPVLYRNNHQRINAFAVVQDYSDVNADAFGRTYQDAEAELFFSRNWEAAGRPSDNLCADYPALILNIYQHRVTNDVIKHDAALTLLFCNLCEGCPSEMPKEAAYQLAMQMLKHVIDDCRNIVQDYKYRMWYGYDTFTSIIGAFNSKNVNDSLHDVLLYKDGAATGVYMRDADNAKGCLSLTVEVQIDDCYLQEPPRPDRDWLGEPKPAGVTNAGK